MEESKKLNQLKPVLQASSSKESMTLTLDADINEVNLPPKLDVSDATPKIRVTRSPNILNRKMTGLSPGSKSPRNLAIKFQRPAGAAKPGNLPSDAQSTTKLDLKNSITVEKANVDWRARSLKQTSDQAPLVLPEKKNIPITNMAFL